MNYYLSNASVEEIRIHLNEVCNEYYAPAIDFLKKHLRTWELETSFDGKIRKPTQLFESEDKIIKIETKNEVLISFFNVPKIRENRWDSLIKATKELSTSLPNHCFSIDTIVVQKLKEKLQMPDVGIIYKALLEICPSGSIQEPVFSILQSASQIPTQGELMLKQGIILHDNFSYYIQQVIQVPIPVIVTIPVIPQQNNIIPMAIGSLDEGDKIILDLF